MIPVQANHRLYTEYHERILNAVDTCLLVEKVCSIDEMACRLMGTERQVDVARELALEATRLLKQDQRTKTIPIIAVTALASPEYEKKGLESGCDAYIPKPITLGNFLRTIESFLKIRPVTPTSFASLAHPMA